MNSRKMFAAGLASLVISPAVAGDWSGLYVGGQIGFLDYEDTTSIGVPSVPPVPAGGTLYDGSGAQYGVFAGYMQDFGQFVLGGEAALSFSSVDLDLTPTGGPGGRKVSQTTELKFKAGYDAGTVLPYAILGYAWQTVDLTGGDQDYDGMSYGLGLDYQLPSGMLAGAELLWYQLENDGPGSSLETDSMALNLRLSYRF